MKRIYTKINYLLLVLLCGLLAPGCNVINPAEQTPTYIHIDSFHLNRTAKVPSKAAVTSHVSTVWAYYNNESIGVFDLPCTFPVIATGTGQLQLSPGVTIDGLNSLLGVYPFYQPDTFSFVAQPGKTITHEGDIHYYDDATIDYSYFDLTGGLSRFSSCVDQGSQTPMVPGYANGVNFEKITLVSPSADSSVDSSVLVFPIPSGTQEAYIEFDYQCTVPFAVGLQANASVINSGPIYIAGAYPSATWQKFYMAVADFNGQYQGTTNNLYFKASLPAGVSSGTVLIANIQLVHF